MSPPPAPRVLSSPFQYLLEVTVLSAQDLQRVNRSMRTYAEAYVDPVHRCRTCLDSTGRTEPTWNDMFVFLVDDAFLFSDTAAVTIDVYASRFALPDVHLGTARVLMSTLLPIRGTRCVTLLIRRPKSLRPQGILNVGVSILHSNTRSLPLLPHPSPAIANPNAEGRVKTKAELPAMSKAKKVHRKRTRRGPAADKESQVLEKKLEKWKQELRPPQNEPNDGKPIGANSARDNSKGTRRFTKKRSIWRILCFVNCYGQSRKLVASPQTRPLPPPPPPPPCIVEEEPLQMREPMLRKTVGRS